MYWALVSVLYGLAITAIFTAISLPPDKHILIFALYGVGVSSTLISLFLTCLPAVKTSYDSRKISVGSLVPVFSALEISVKTSEKLFNVRQFVDIENLSDKLIVIKAVVTSNVNGVGGNIVTFNAFVYPRKTARILASGVENLSILETGDIPQLDCWMKYHIRYDISGRKNFERVTSRKITCTNGGKIPLVRPGTERVWNTSVLYTEEVEE